MILVDEPRRLPFLQASHFGDAEAEYGYQRAVALAPEIAWWNARLVTFLIRRSRYAAADEEWGRAVHRLDPTGERIWESSWLAKNAHRWVVREWLARGEVVRARAVFDSIPDEIVEADDELLRQRQEVEDAAEAEQLGESVYPASVPVRERWSAPRALAKRLSKGVELRRWFPGRVVRVSAEEVVLVIASPEDRRVFSRPVSGKDWDKLAPWCAPDDAIGRFVELGEYSNGRLLVLPASGSSDQGVGAAGAESEAPLSGRWLT